MIKSFFKKFISKNRDMILEEGQHITGFHGAFDETQKHGARLDAGGNS